MPSTARSTWFVRWPVTTSTDSDLRPDSIDEQEEPAARAAVWGGRVLSDVGIFAIAFAARVLFSVGRRTFTISADEPATLAMARYISSGDRWNMFDSATWQPGLAVLLAPLHWFLDDPSDLYRAALVVNAAIGAASVVVLVRVIGALTDTTGTRERVLALVTSTMPAAIAPVAFVWAEPLVSLTFLISMLAVFEFHASGSTRWAIVALLAATVGYGSHGRLLALLGITIALIAWRLFRLGRRRDAIVFGSVGVACATAVQVVSGFLFERIWDQPAGTNTVGSTLRRLTDPASVVVSASGQIWYALVTSAGLAGIGTVVLVRRAIGPSGEPGVSNARIAILMTTPLIVTSIIFMADRERFDQAIYGRYNDAIIAPVIAIGIAWLASRTECHRQQRLTQGALTALALTVASVGAAGIVLVAREEIVDQAGYLAPMIPGVLAYVSPSTRPDLLGVTLVSAGLTLLVVIVSPRVTGRLAPFGVVLVAIVAVGAFRTHGGLETDVNQNLRRSAAEELVEVDLPEREQIGFVFDGSSAVTPLSLQHLNVHVYQWWLPTHEFVGSEQRTEYLFAPVDNVALRESVATVVWVDTKTGITLWKRDIDGD